MGGRGRELAGSPLLPGDPRELGGYRLLARLGEGGMGRVYLGRSAGGRPVAVKVIRTDVAAADEFRRRFRSEVKRARRVPPFCTAEVLDADPDHDPPYLVQEYVEGPDLASVVHQQGPLSPGNLHGLAIGMATALTAIHDAGVIHRDLKPSNVLLAPGSPKVIDFGIAQAVDTAAEHTDPGMLVGTVAYMAPERFESGPGIGLTPAADVFSWGAVVAFAGLGRVPFAGDTLPSLAMSIVTSEPDLSGLDGDLRALVQRALAKDPGQRPSARQLLNTLLSGTTVTGTVASSRTGVPAGAGGYDTLRLGQPATLRMPQSSTGPTEPAPKVPARHAGKAPATRPGHRRRLLAIGLSVLVTATVVALAALLGGMLPVPLSPGTATTPPAGSTAPAAAQPPRERILTDPLSAPGYWWERVDDTHEVTCTFADGLVIRSGGAASYRCPGPRDTLSDLAVYVDVTLLEPGSCGSVWFRFTVRDGGYALRICQDGYYLVTHGFADPSSVVTLRTVRFDAPLPLGQPIRVGIVAEGPELAFYRDDSVRFTWSHQAFAEGEVALGILQMDNAYGPPYQVRFANIEVLARPH